MCKKLPQFFGSDNILYSTNIVFAGFALDLHCDIVIVLSVT